MDNDDIDTDMLEERAIERKRLARLRNWCDDCHGFTGPGSPCHEPEESADGETAGVDVGQEGQQ